MNYSVVYINDTDAWLQYDNYNTLVATVYAARVQLIRGYDAIRQRKKRGSSKDLNFELRMSEDGSMRESSPIVAASDASTPERRTSFYAEEEEEGKNMSRQIDHLVLVIHGFC